MKIKRSEKRFPPRQVNGKDQYCDDIQVARNVASVDARNLRNRGFSKECICGVIESHLSKSYEKLLETC